MQVAEFVGVVPPALGFGALFLDHRYLAPGALLGEPDDPQQVCAHPAVGSPSREQLGVTHPPGLEHAAVLPIATAAVTALRHVVPSYDPHATHSTKGERNRQIEGEIHPNG